MNENACEVCGVAAWTECKEECSEHPNNLSPSSLRLLLKQRADRIKELAERVGFVERVAHLNQSDAIYAQQRAAFLDKMLQKERERVAKLEAALEHIAKGFAALPDDNSRVIDGYYRGLATEALTRP